MQSQTGQIVIGTRELESLIRRVSTAAAADTYDLLDNIGQQQEDSARRRIFETKRTPNGERWEPWSPRYAAKRHPGQTLLRNEGPLGDSVTHVVDAPSAVEVGSNLEYANVHLYGVSYTRVSDRAQINIPARPYLDTDGGFADSSDRDEIRDFVRAFLGGLL